MSILTAESTVPLHVWERRTFDFSWLFTIDGEPVDLTDWLAWLVIYGADITAPVKTLADGGVAPTPTVEGTTGMILGGTEGTIRAYCTDEDAAGVLTSLFNQVRIPKEGV